MTQTAVWDAMAEHYYEEAITPFAPEVDFEIGVDINKVAEKWQIDGTLENRVAIDFGCGCGDGIRLLAGKFGIVAGVDYSENMLKECLQRLRREGLEVNRLERDGLKALSRKIRGVKRKAGNTSQTFLLKGNMAGLQPLSQKVDLALATSSIVGPTKMTNKRMFRGVAESLASGSTLIMVLPSLDAMYYLFRLYRSHNIDHDELGTIEETHGIFIEPTGVKQKFYTPDDITGLLEENNLNLIEMKKVLYPWSLMRKFNWGYFPRCPRIWDWYVIAQRQ